MSGKPSALTMATFKCARCNYLRQSATEACDKCGWAPKKESYEAAARDAGAGIIDEVVARAADKRRERQAGAVVGVVVLLLFLAHWLSREPLGGPCEENDDCRGKLCLQMSSSPNICSARCDDSECDDGWACAGATQTSTNRRTFLRHESSAKVCVPVRALPPPEPEPLPPDVELEPSGEPVNPE